MADLVKWTEQSTEDWYLRHTGEAGLTSIITNTTTPPNIRELARQLLDKFRGETVVDEDILAFEQAIREARLQPPAPLLDPVEGTGAFPTEDFTQANELLSDPLIDNAFRETYSVLEPATLDFQPQVPTIEFSETVYNEFGEVVAEDLRPMEIITGADEAEALRGWTSIVDNIFPQEWIDGISSRMGRLGGYRYIELMEENGFVVEAEAEGVVAQATRSIMTQLPKFGRFLAGSAEFLAYGFAVGFAVMGVVEAIKLLTGVDIQPVLDGMTAMRSKSLEQLTNTDETIPMPGGSDRFEMRRRPDGLFVQVEKEGYKRKKAVVQLINFVNKIDELRKTLNRIYNCYYTLVDKQPFSPALRKITIVSGMDYDQNTVMDYSSESRFNLGWCEDPLLLKRIDERITMVRNFSPYTDNPTNYNTGWTFEDRVAWENEALKIMFSMIKADSFRIAEELDYRKDKIGDKEKDLTEDILFQNLPTSLAFWALIWSCKAYSDPEDNFADKLLKGYAPFGQFDFNNKPIDTTFDFVVERVDSEWGWLDIDWWLSTTFAYSPSQDILYVAWRGTDFNQFTGYTDGVGLSRLVRNATLDATGFGGFGAYDYHQGIENHLFKVYPGFLKAFNIMKDKVVARLSYLTTVYNPREVIFTGHSLGSAMAQIAMVDDDTAKYATAYIGFGTPRCFSSEDVVVYNKYWKNRSWRVNNIDDIVSAIPFPKLGYRYVGKGVFIDRLNRTVAVSDGDYRFKHYGDYTQLGMVGHGRVAYLDSLCDLEIPRPANIPQLPLKTASASAIMNRIRSGLTDQATLISNETLNGVYLRSCAYKAFTIQAKLNKPKVVVKLLKLFLEFGKLDLNIDGTLDRTEYEHHGRRLRGRRLPEGEQLPMPSFDFMDMNGDGLISFKEYLTQSIASITGDLNVVPKPFDPFPSIDVEAVKILGLAILPPRTSSNLIEYLVVL